MAFFIFLYFVFFWFITEKNISNGFFLLAALLPSYLIRFHLFFPFLPSTLLEGMIIIIFLISGKKFWQKKKSFSAFWQSLPFHWLCLTLLVLSFLAIFPAPSLWKALGLWRAYFLEPFLLYLAIWAERDNPKLLSSILTGLGITALGISLFAFYQKITGRFIPVAMWRPAAVRRVTSFYTSPNAVGLILAPIILLYVGWLTKSKNIFLKLLKISLILICLLAIYFAHSRGTYLGLFIAFLYLAFFWCQKKFSFSPRLFFLIFFSVIILGCLTVSLPFSSKISSLLHSRSAQNRFILWQGTWQYLSQTPSHFILGAGIFGFPPIQNKFRNPKIMEPLIYPHNIFLNFWINIGLLGTIIFFWLFFAFFVKIQKNYSKQKDFFLLGINGAFLTILGHGLVDVPYFKNDLATLFWLILGIGILFLYHSTHGKN